MIKEEDICYICYDVNNENSIQLKCNHTFHYDCILSSFLREPRLCPYCRQIHGYLTLKKNMTPIQNIHKEFGITLYSPFYYEPIKCKGILKSGHSCNFKPKFKSNYCGKHQKME